MSVVGVSKGTKPPAKGPKKPEQADGLGRATAVRNISNFLEDSEALPIQLTLDLL